MEAESGDPKTPGQLIESLLEKRGWNQIVLGLVLGVERTTANKLVTGKKPVDAEIALMLESAFDVPAERFLELQKNMDLAMARLAARPNAKGEIRAHLFRGLPISEMIKRGWISAEDVRDVPKVEAGLIKFFGADSLSEIEILPHAAKKTNVASPASPVQIAWLYRVKTLAEDMLVGRYSPSSVKGAVEKLSKLLASPEEIRHVPKILAECGVRFIIVESLSSAKIDGVCFWLNATSPVIGMSLRYDRIDNFWFVLRHELEHVIQLHGLSEMMLDAELEGDKAGTTENIPEEERIANDAAGRFCVPAKQMQSFIERKAPFFAERDILGFAKTYGIHPGLVAGQLARHTGRYERFRKHLVKVRSIVSPGAMVDGWGDVAPVDD